MMKRFHAAKRGFTFPEVLLCSIIIVVLWLGPLNILIGSVRNVSQAQHVTQAIYLAKFKMEQVRRYPFTSLGTADTGINPVWIPTDANMGGNQFPGSYSVTVSNTTPTNTYMRRVRVAITWNERALGQALRQSLTTDIANEPQLN